MALLDTTLLVDLGRRAQSPRHRRATALLRDIIAEGQTLFTSRINEAEFRVGPELSDDRPKEMERVERILSALVILEFDAGAARRYAAIKALLMKRGRPAGDCDMLIAAIAIANGEPLLTRNPKHFEGMPGLTVVSY